MAKRFTELKERLDKKAANDPEVRRLREKARECRVGGAVPLEPRDSGQIPGGTGTHL